MDHVTRRDNKEKTEGEGAESLLHSTKTSVSSTRPDPVAIEMIDLTPRQIEEDQKPLVNVYRSLCILKYLSY